MRTAIARAVATLLIVAAAPLVAGAQTAQSAPPAAQPPTQLPAPASTPTPSGSRLLTAADLEPFMDGLVQVEIDRHNIAGAVVSVVKDGALLWSKGYGFADIARKIPVSPESTLFRVASISKLFTGTAIMQLVEQGKLDLDEDIDRYLDFKVPRRFPDRITLRHIMTHTAGFEEAFKQLPADRGKGVALRDWATRMTPAQIYKPGTVTSYSNYAVDLGGYIVERVSGMPFAEYVRVHILEPLGMRHSSIAEPLPAGLRRLVAEGYDVASDTAKPFEVIQGEPSGNMSSTGNDMANFAIAHLQLGRFGETRILSEESAKLMGTTQFRTHPEVPGMGLSFFEEHRHGYRIIGHGGDLSRMHSHLSLLMDEGVAIFVSVNSAGSGGGLYDVRESIRDRFIERYFPRRTPVEPVVADAKAEAAKVTGSYTLSRRGETSLGRMLGLAVPLTVVANEDGTIQIPFVTGVNGQPVRWTPIGAMTFRNADGSQRIAFTPAANGLPMRMALFGGHELHRVGTLDARGFNLIVVCSALVVFLAVLLLWPVAGVVRRRYRQSAPDDGVGSRLRGWTRVVALLNLLFVVGMGLFLYLGFTEVFKLDSRVDWVLILIRVVSVLGALGTVFVLLALVRSLTQGVNGWARLKYFVLLVSCVGFTWFAVHWNWLAVKLAY